MKSASVRLSVRLWEALYKFSNTIQKVQYNGTVLLTRHCIYGGLITLIILFLSFSLQGGTCEWGNVLWDAFHFLLFCVRQCMLSFMNTFDIWNDSAVYHDFNYPVWRSLCYLMLLCVVLVVVFVSSQTHGLFIVINYSVCCCNNHCTFSDQFQCTLSFLISFKLKTSFCWNIYGLFWSKLVHFCTV